MSEQVGRMQPAPEGRSRRRFLPIIRSSPPGGGWWAGCRQDAVEGGGGQQLVHRAQAHWLPFSASLSLFPCLGPPGRRGKPGRRGDPGESQVFLVCKLRPRSPPWTRDVVGCANPPEPHYSGPQSQRPQCPVPLCLGFLTSQVQ